MTAIEEQKCRQSCEEKQNNVAEPSSCARINGKTVAGMYYLVIDITNYNVLEPSSVLTKRPKFVVKFYLRSIKILFLYEPS